MEGKEGLGVHRAQRLEGVHSNGAAGVLFLQRDTKCNLTAREMGCPEYKPVHWAQNS